MNTLPDRTIRTFNPGTFQSDEEIIKQFVVRERELGIVLDTLRGNIDSESCQHTLIIAPRGGGKTMLLARIAAELNADNEFSERLLPVRFMEESHEIFDLADFWLETLFYLSKESARHDPQLATELQETYNDLVKRWGEETLANHVRATVLDAADRLDRKLVLMIENMQSLCENVDDDFGWQLRGALQSEPQIMLLATATNRFSQMDDVQQPFFELLQTIDLKPLNTEECRRLWHVVSGDEAVGREIRPLEILTGGSSRLLVIIAGFAQRRSLHQLMENLVQLIDDHTEYFRGHLEALAKTERRVYLAAIDLWQPSSTGEIAARARMDVRSVSALLGRLVDRGMVIVDRNGTKRLYVATERMYCLYYKLRRERDEAAVIQNLIHFMAAFYSPEKEQKVRENMVSEHRGIYTCRTMQRQSENLLESRQREATVDLLHWIYFMFLPSDHSMMKEIQRIVLDLVAASTPVQDIVEILSSDIMKANTLTPLIIALRQYDGETVRAPVEVLEVAVDIRKRIAERIADVAGTSVSLSGESGLIHSADLNDSAALLDRMGKDGE